MGIISFIKSIFGKKKPRSRLVNPYFNPILSPRGVDISNIFLPPIVDEVSKEEHLKLLRILLRTNVPSLNAAYEYRKFIHLADILEVTSSDLTSEEISNISNPIDNSKSNSTSKQDEAEYDEKQSECRKNQELESERVNLNKEESEDIALKSSISPNSSSIFKLKLSEDDIETKEDGTIPIIVEDLTHSEKNRMTKSVSEALIARN